ncbi:Uncharacterised protein [Mycobacterium tuberculosis]|nr:Uncharacterised protein [Mycobacterium tuberculosis]
MPTRPASPDKPAKPPAALAGARVNGASGAASRGSAAGSNARVCSSSVLTSAMVSVMIVPMASTVVNIGVKAIVAGLPDANAAARSAPMNAKVCDRKAT